MMTLSEWEEKSVCDEGRKHVGGVLGTAMSRGKYHADWRADEVTGGHSFRADIRPETFREISEDLRKRLEYADGVEE